MPQLILNALGPDRPGIVGQVTGHLHAAGANVLDSRMVNLRGQFALLLLVEAPDDALANLRQSLPALADSIGLRLSRLSRPCYDLDFAGVLPSHGCAFRRSNRLYE